jgi:uncharacterized repeat protein (TIGR03943 family)
MNLFPRRRLLTRKILLPSLDILAILAWGALLLKYRLTKQLYLLIHPNYFGLVAATGVILLLVGAVRGGQWLKTLPKTLRRRPTQPAELPVAVSHVTLLPLGLGSGLLLLAAVVGLATSPSVLTSQVALQRGITETLPATQLQAAAFRTETKPEERSLVEWVRTLSAYPEPEAYQGQKANVTGFVIQLPALPDNYLFLSRFVITCCAVDARAVGIPVKLDESRSAYPADTWLTVTGEMAVETLPVDPQMMKEVPGGERQLVLAAQSLKTIPAPADPYGY